MENNNTGREEVLEVGRQIKKKKLQQKLKCTKKATQRLRCLLQSVSIVQDDKEALIAALKHNGCGLMIH